MGFLRAIYVVDPPKGLGVNLSSNTVESLHVIPQPGPQTYLKNISMEPYPKAPGTIWSFLGQGLGLWRLRFGVPL